MHQLELRSSNLELSNSLDIECFGLAQCLANLVFIIYFKMSHNENTIKFDEFLKIINLLQSTDEEVRKLAIEILMPYKLQITSNNKSMMFHCMCSTWVINPSHSYMFTEKGELRTELSEKDYLELYNLLWN